ncbi:MAG: T9SS type A sorting domain-containing protein [Candidatus Latescibacterota bacterium]|nr:MAG: T9SS type A sorting domain-containing protein [Candidatus Latescibacterota bacterium]
MPLSRRLFFALISLTAIFIFQTIDTDAKRVRKGPQGKRFPGMDRVLVLDGSNVHDVGEVHIHVGNWGMFGSWPGSGVQFSEAPSMQWPAGSGVEYLFASGLWIGAIKNGIPAVSTSTFAAEMRPTSDPIDIIYRSAEGATGGNRMPHPLADDDGDGTIDEDWLNGRDDDNDGKIDEDFAAISDQMFSCWFTDDQPEAIEIFPEHNPLHVLVRQESYQWEDDRFDDFVGIDFKITNIGNDVLEDVYVAFFADFDAGPLNTGNYWADDAAGFIRTPVICTDLGPVDHLDIAYGYDADGDGGQTPGYAGVALLDHTTDPTGNEAPRFVGVSTYANFSGNQPFEEGGDPTNDFERYELLSQQTIERDATVPRDYRMLMGVGPFERLEPGETLVFRIALVVGEGLDGMIEHAAYAKRLFNGTWYDIDGDPMTGIDRRETPVYGPAENVVIDECRPELSDPIPLVPPGSVVWVNNDCESEDNFKSTCGYAEADSLVFRTGVAGKETQIHWVLAGEFVEATLDIQPGHCPNRLNNKRQGKGEPKNDDSMMGGVLHVALHGRAGFDVADVDVGSLRLEGVSPVKKPKYRDVGSPVMGEALCQCPTGEPDGITDLVLKFQAREILAALAPASDGDRKTLTLSGRLMDGTEFFAIDCVTIEGKKIDRVSASVEGRVVLRPTSPNPFNPIAWIGYSLPQPGFVKLSIYDVTGKLVERLVEEDRPAGEHLVEWDAARFASGVYFYRLEVGEFVETRRMVLLK